MPAGIQPAIAGVLGTRVQTWRDRLRKASYTSPSGKNIEFDWVAASQEFDKRTVGWEFPEIEDAYVQDNGIGARRYPMLCIFWGPHHDLLATAFMTALAERGAGTLSHPIYGQFKVNPFGTIVRRNDLVNEANQSVVEVTFWTTTGVVYPTTKPSSRNEIHAALGAFDAAAAQRFQAVARVDRTPAQLNMMARARKFLRNVQAALQKTAAKVSSVNRKFRELQRTINLGLDVLVGQPLELARQVSNLIKAPGLALVGIGERLEGYHALAQTIMASIGTSATQVIPGIPGTSLDRLRQKYSNDFHLADLFVLNAISGSALSALENTYATRQEAMATAEALLQQLSEAVLWRDERVEGLDQVDTGESYQALLNVVGLVLGYLVNSSESISGGPAQVTVAAEGAAMAVTVPAVILAKGRALVQQRVILDRARTIIDVCAEYYGDPDAEGILDFLINTNNLTGSDLLELQSGRILAIYR